MHKDNIVQQQREFKTKNISLKMSDVDTLEGIITGYAATKNLRDSHGDIIADGAFEDTIVKWGPKVEIE